MRVRTCAAGLVAAVAAATMLMPGVPASAASQLAASRPESRTTRVATPTLVKRATLSADFAIRAQRAGARVARFTVAGGHSMLRRAHLWHTFARDVVLAGAGFAPERADVRAAMGSDTPESLAVPLDVPRRR